MQAIIAEAIRILSKLLDKVPDAQREDACRALELELARQRVLLRANRKLQERKKRR